MLKAKQGGVQPGLAPPGYLNELKGNRIASVVLDPANSEQENLKQTEGEGFEPPVGKTLHQFSRLTPSTTRPPLQSPYYSK